MNIIKSNVYINYDSRFYKLKKALGQVFPAARSGSNFFELYGYDELDKTFLELTLPEM